jgi:hypothetical protein
MNYAPHTELARLKSRLVWGLFACVLCGILGFSGVAAVALSGCSSGGVDGVGGTDATTGDAFSVPSELKTTTYNEDEAEAGPNCTIDVAHADDGYVVATAKNDARLKFQVVASDMSYNYDLPGDGTPLVVPINMGNGSYNFRIMQNTSGNNYVELFSTAQEVQLSDDKAPFLVPNVFVNYDENSEVVKKARELAADCENEADVVRAVYNWVVENIKYDNDKAAKLATATGYIPNPDETLQEGKGICFDYASLGAAMLRSLGIPCKVVTGYVSPNNVYHAWNMVYIDGEWVSSKIIIPSHTWSRIDLTFAAGGASSTVGDGTSYTDRYIY